MSSERQIAANQANARSSTGPRTAAGKAKVSENALKHGLTGRQVVLPNENPDDFEFFRAALLSRLDPKDAFEGALVEKIITDFWRQRRIPILEAALYRRDSAELLARQAARAVAVRQLELTKDPILTALKRKKFGTRYVEDDEQRRAREHAELDDHVTDLLKHYPEPLLNLWRHEAALGRSLSRNMHELERLQAQRSGQHVPVPAALDVNVTLSESSETDGDRQ